MQGIFEELGVPGAGVEVSELMSDYDNPALRGSEFAAMISSREASVLEGLRQMHPAHAKAWSLQLGRNPRFTPSGHSMPSFANAGFEEETPFDQDASDFTNWKRWYRGRHGRGQDAPFVEKAGKGMPYDMTQSDWIHWEAWYKEGRGRAPEAPFRPAEVWEKPSQEMAPGQSRQQEAQEDAIRDAWGRIAGPLRGFLGRASEIMGPRRNLLGGAPQARVFLQHYQRLLGTRQFSEAAYRTDIMNLRGEERGIQDLVTTGQMTAVETLSQTALAMAGRSRQTDPAGNISQALATLEANLPFKDFAGLVGPSTQLQGILGQTQGRSALSIDPNAPAIIARLSQSLGNLQQAATGATQAVQGTTQALGGGPQGVGGPGGGGGPQMTAASAAASVGGGPPAGAGGPVLPIGNLYGIAGGAGGAGGGRGGFRGAFQKALEGGQLMSGLQMFYLSRMWGLFSEPALQGAFTGAENYLGAYNVGLQAGVPQAGGLTSPMPSAIYGRALGQYRYGQAGMATWGPAINAFYGVQGENADLLARLQPAVGAGVMGMALGGMGFGPPGAAVGGLAGFFGGLALGEWGVSESKKNDPAYRALTAFREQQNVRGAGALQRYPRNYQATRLPGGQTVQDMMDISRGGQMAEAARTGSYGDLMKLPEQYRTMTIQENISQIMGQFNLLEDQARNVSYWSYLEKTGIQGPAAEAMAQQSRLGIDRMQITRGLARRMGQVYDPGAPAFAEVTAAANQYINPEAAVRFEEAAPWERFSRLTGMNMERALPALQDFRGTIEGRLERDLMGGRGTTGAVGLGTAIQNRLAAGDLTGAFRLSGTDEMVGGMGGFMRQIGRGRDIQGMETFMRANGDPNAMATMMGPFGAGWQYTNQMSQARAAFGMPTGGNAGFFNQTLQRTMTMTADQMTVNAQSVNIVSQAAMQAVPFTGQQAMQPYIAQATMGQTSSQRAIDIASGMGNFAQTANWLGARGISDRGAGGFLTERFGRPEVSNLASLITREFVQGRGEGVPAQWLAAWSGTAAPAMIKQEEQIRGADIAFQYNIQTGGWNINRAIMQERLKDARINQRAVVAGARGEQTGFAGDSWQIGAFSRQADVIEDFMDLPEFRASGGGGGGASAADRAARIAQMTGVGITNYQLQWPGPMGAVGQNIPQQFTSMGRQFVTSQWGLQDANNALSFAQQMASWNYGNQSNQLARAQFNQTWDFNRQAAQTQYGWQLQDFAWQDRMTGLQRGFAQQQWGWQAQDFGLRRQEMNMRRGWQIEDRGMEALGRGFTQDIRLENRAFSQMMRGRERTWMLEDRGFEDVDRGRHRLWQTEDLDEAIRFSRGRERRQLLRQRERIGEDRSSEDAAIKRMRDRQDEMYASQEEHIKKIQGLEDKMWKLEDEHFTTRTEREDAVWKLQTERFEIDVERFEATKEQQKAVWDLEDERTATMKARAAQAFELQMQRMDMEKDQFMARWELQNDYHQQQLKFIGEQQNLTLISIQLERTFFVELMQGLQDAIAAARQLQAEAEAAAAAVAAIPTGSVGGYRLAAGGFTGLITRPTRVLVGETGPEMMEVYPASSPRSWQAARGGGRTSAADLAAALNGVAITLLVDGKQMKGYLKAHARETLYLESVR